MRDVELILKLNRLGYVVLESRSPGYFNLEKDGKKFGPYNRNQLVKKANEEYDNEGKFW